MSKAFGVTKSSLDRDGSTVILKRAILYPIPGYCLTGYSCFGQSGLFGVMVTPKITRVAIGDVAVILFRRIPGLVCVSATSDQELSDEPITLRI